MNKSDLIEVVTTKLGDRRTASAAVEAVVDAITRAVARGEKVGISGFGVFERVERAARTARNPTTGEAVPLDRTTVPKFRPGQGFKDIVSGAKEVSPESGPRAVTARAGIPRKVADAVAGALPSAATADGGDEGAPARASRSAPPQARGTATARQSAKAVPAKATPPTAAPAKTGPAKAAKAAPGKAAKAAAGTSVPAPAAAGGSSARAAVKAPAGSAAARAGGGRTVAAPGAARSAAAAKAPGRTAAAKAAGTPATTAAEAPARRTPRS